jgi:hypothetical protein
MKDEIIIYQAEKTSARLEVRIEEDSVWLNRKQIRLCLKEILKQLANILPMF